MYGFIPAVSPPDLPYGLAPREIVPRGDGGAIPFAEQLAQLDAKRFDQSRHDEKARVEADSEKQRHNAEESAKRAASQETSEKQRTDASSDAARHETRAARTADKDADSQKTAKHDGDSEDAGAHEAQDAAGRGAAEKASHHEKRIDRSGTDKSADSDAADQADKEEKKAHPAEHADAAKKAETAEKAETAGAAAAGMLNAEQAIAAEKSTPAQKDETDGSAKVGAKKRGTHADAPGPHTARKNSPSGTEPPSVKTSQLGADDDAQLAKQTALEDAAAESEREETNPRSERLRAQAEKPSDGDSAELKNVEALVDRKERTDDAERDRRIRGGQDPRERRLAAEKAGTRTVDAKAVSPVEAENTNTERTVTRELTVDLSDATAQHRDGGESGNSDNSLATGRLHVGLGDTSSRSPSISQATQTLARRLNGDLGDNIVRQAKVMLQDSNHAELRLVIRPPELGRVRIRLQMENGHIAGRILVDNGNVREVVEQNLASLQRAFQEAGLEMGDLEVSTGDARDEADRNDQGQGGSTKPAAIAGAESFGRSIETISEYEPGRHRINLVA
ncbi:MAG: flagellar hook-length control protein FliK [Alkalispirochaeta sp.]